jgi:hypothetical protein
LERLRRAQARSDAKYGPDGGPGLGPESNRLIRDADGRIIKPPPSRIRTAILEQLGRRQMTRYKLWKIARRKCPALPQSAVYEFLRGFRQIGLGYIEALLTAVDLDLVVAAKGRARKG